jgi:Ca2+-binding RTX toxin-like protein
MVLIIEGTSGNDFLRGSNGEDIIFGFGGNDTITGQLGVDTMHGGIGVDYLDNRFSTDRWLIDLLLEVSENLSVDAIEEITGFENVFGSQGGDSIRGTNGANALEGEGGNDTLFGRGGNDTLEGEAGNDQLWGDSGNDRLIGGQGRDLFGFRTSDVATDRIVGFDGVGAADADRIDLRQIDAIAGGNDDAFQFFGVLTDAQGLAEGRGSLWLHDDSDSSVTIVHGNIDGDDVVELTIRIEDGAASANDYRDGDFFF